MAYREHLVLLIFLCLSRLFSCSVEENLLQRTKRALTSICVEIKPGGPLEEPYFMCRGTDFIRGGQILEVPAAITQSGGPYINYGSAPSQQKWQNAPIPASQPAASYQQVAPTPLLPAEFFQAPPTTSYESIYGGAQTNSSPSSIFRAPTQRESKTQQQQKQSTEYSSPSAFAPANTAQLYGLQRVSYPGTTGTAAAAGGSATSPSSAAQATAYGAPTNEKPTKEDKHVKQQPPQRYAENSYNALLGSRHHAALDEDALAVPNVGFKPQEPNHYYRQPQPKLSDEYLQVQRQPMLMVPGMSPQYTAVLPLAQAQLQQPTVPVGASEYINDPVMRSFYSSLSVPDFKHIDPPSYASLTEQQEPLIGRAAMPYQDSTRYTQLKPAFASSTGSVSVLPPTQMAPSVAHDQLTNQPVDYSEAQKNVGTYVSTQGQTAALQPASNNCNSYGSVQELCSAEKVSCNGCRMPNYPDTSPGQCSTANNNGYAQTCPSYQPVIITMPCYGQPPSTQYMAVPSGGYGSVNSAAGLPRTHVNEPMLGSPFGMAPMLNPFGPFGSLNPFNPFNRLLGVAAPVPHHPQLAAANPLQRLFQLGGDQKTAMDAEVTQRPTEKPSKINFNLFSTAAPKSNGKVGSPAADYTGDDDADEDGSELSDNAATDVPQSEPTDDGATSMGITSASTDQLTATELLDNAEEKLKSKDVSKLKRHNNRGGNNNAHKRKYVQSL